MEKGKFVFDDDEGSGAGFTWKYGTFTDNEGKEFPFSVCVMDDGLTDVLSYELTWVEETPDDSDFIEAEIINSLE